jgi:hypothetical protein
MNSEVVRQSVSTTVISSLVTGERIAAGMAQHVRMGLELKAGPGGGTLDHPGKAGGGEWASALADEDEGRRRALALQSAQCPQPVLKCTTGKNIQLPLGLLATRARYGLR